MTIFILKGVFAYREAASKVMVGDAVSVEPEPTNPHDARALCVKHGGNVVGYISRGSDQVRMRRELSRGVRAKVTASDYDYLSIATETVQT